MNIYVVTEGKTEAALYKHWIPLVNQKLKVIDNLGDLGQESLYIISAQGYPDYFSIIDAAILDVNQFRTFDRLVITVDSEDMTRQEKYDEINNHVAPKGCVATIKIVIQHFCIETWALGNRALMKKNPSTARLINYKRLFDVRVNDPELLPPKSDESLNRSQFAERYLRAALNERHSTLTYSKGRPQALMHYKYFGEVKGRYTETGHINSFGDFLAAFV